MLSLEAQGKTRGVALLLDPATLDEELQVLWSREMLTGAYVPIWARVRLEGDQEIWAIVFVSNSDHPLYEADARVQTVAPLISAASGPLGSNASYVFLLDRALSELSLNDPYVHQIAAQLATNVTTESPASAN
jgi:cation transport protein ChaC